MNKDWRYKCKTDFLNEAFVYISKHIINIMDNIGDIINETKIDRVKKYYTDYINAINRGEDLEEIIKIGSNIVKEDVVNWSQVSTNRNTTIKEIVLRILIGRLCHFNYIAVILLHDNINITEDIIDEITYITSKYFSFREWDDDHVKAVSSCAAGKIEPTKDKEMKKLYSSERLCSDLIAVKFDIDSYSGFLSDKFKKKYIKHINVNKNISIASLQI